MKSVEYLGVILVFIGFCFAIVGSYSPLQSEIVRLWPSQLWSLIWQLSIVAAMMFMVGGGLLIQILRRR